MIFRNFFGQEAMQSFASAFKPAVEEKGFRCDVVMEIEDSPEREPHLAKHFPEDMEVEKTDGEKKKNSNLKVACQAMVAKQRPLQSAPSSHLTLKPKSLHRLHWQRLQVRPKRPSSTGVTKSVADTSPLR